MAGARTWIAPADFRDPVIAITQRASALIAIGQISRTDAHFP
jgi:hypothetical protein